MGPLKVRKPQAILFDIISTATKSFFIDQILWPYIRMNAKTFLENNWTNSVIQHDVELLRAAAKKEKSEVQIPDDSADADKIQQAVCEYVFKALKDLKDNEAMTQFKFHVLFDGYAKGNIETPVYTDVACAIRHWAVDDNIKLYVLSNGWKEATKRYLQKTNHGDMNLLIEDHFDTSEGSLTEPATFKRVVGKIKCAAEDILFLTHSGPEATAAKTAGLSVILMMTHRRDVTRLSEEEKKAIPYVRSFNELVFTGDAPKAHYLDGSSNVDFDDDQSMKKTAKSDKSSENSAMKSGDSKSGQSTTGSKKSKSKSSDGSKSASKSEAKSEEALSTTFSNSAAQSKKTSTSKTKSNDGSVAKSKSGTSAKSNKAPSKASSKSTNGSKMGESVKSKAASKKSSATSKDKSSNKKSSKSTSKSKSKSSASEDGGGKSASKSSVKSNKEKIAASKEKSNAAASKSKSTDGGSKSKSKSTSGSKKAPGDGDSKSKEK